jgi:phosphatidylglycerol---prolipoprotein diacylglyceryl transferase
MDMVDNGPYRCLAVHPTQLYSSANALVGCGILYLFWRRSRNRRNAKKLLAKPGSTFGLMFIFYGVTRFGLEFVRDDNPFEFDSLTVSQNISIAMIVLGIVLAVVFEKAKPGVSQPKA